MATTPAVDAHALAGVDALPFAEVDPSVELSQRAIPARNLETREGTLRRQSSPVSQQQLSKVYEAVLDGFVSPVQIWEKLRVPRGQFRLRHLAQDLSLFPTMPLDVEIEVLSYLYPQELSRVARTNKIFHQLLHSSISDALWRNAVLAQKRERRKDAVLAVASLALRTPVPGGPRHSYYPPPHTVTTLTFPPLAAFIDDDSTLDEPFSEDDPRLDAALAQARDYVQAWCAETRAMLVSLLPGSESESTTTEQLPRLELATSVFRVRRYDGQVDTVLGWNQARAHLHWSHDAPTPQPPEQRLVHFSPKGSAVATALVRLLGLDTLTATGDDMDSADARFVCRNCPIPTHGRQEALSWRDCVVHDVDGPNTHALASWALLSPLASANIRRREVPDDYSQLPVWSCNLCTEFSRRPSRQAEITEHVRVVHEVRYITEGLHLISFLGPQRPYRRRVPLLEGKFPARYRCTHCAAASPQNVKLLPMRSLVPHLTDRLLRRLKVIG
ncbi:hypothetical protein C8R46DRAFT_1208259 [Mycena filopes]|nr:hypothetical protein C8R46DRAFT_1208259 [Mycena filopes]